MEAPFTAVLFVVGVICIVNLAVSILVIRSPFYSHAQKAAQCALVWLIPLLGPVAVWAFLRAQYNWQKFDTRAYPERSQKMVGVEINDAINGGHGGSGEVGGHD